MPANQIYHLSWEEFHRDTRSLARILLGKPWRSVICIARGGLVPGAIIGRELNIRHIDTLCISSYDHDRQGALDILKAVEGDGENCLLVDDLVDTGKTAEAARRLLPKATFVAVYAKPAAKSLAHHFVREFAQDIWIHFPWDTEMHYSEPLANQTGQSPSGRVE